MSFLPRDASWFDNIQPTLRSQFEAFQAELSDSQSQAVADLIVSDDPATIWEVSDLSHRMSNGKTLGKVLLLLSYWHGDFDMYNDEQLARFRRYVG